MLTRLLQEWSVLVFRGDTARLSLSLMPSYPGSLILPCPLGLSPPRPRDSLRSSLIARRCPPSSASPPSTPSSSRPTAPRGASSRPSRTSLCRRSLWRVPWRGLLMPCLRLRWVRRSCQTEVFSDPCHFTPIPLQTYFSAVRLFFTPLERVGAGCSGLEQVRAGCMPVSSRLGGPVLPTCHPACPLYSPD